MGYKIKRIKSEPKTVLYFPDKEKTNKVWTSDLSEAYIFEKYISAVMVANSIPTMDTLEIIDDLYRH